MEDLMENKLSSPNRTPSTLTMHKNSQTICKTKPKIRIIHIFAPEIIKTDAANFRELVQRLTGKPSGDDESQKKMKLPRNIISRKPRIFSTSSNSKKMEMAMRAGLGFRERIKGEEEIWKSANSGGGFLGGLGDQFDYGFMQEMNQFPFLEGTTPQVHMDACAVLESQLAN